MCLVYKIQDNKNVLAFYLNVFDQRTIFSNKKAAYFVVVREQMQITYLLCCVIIGYGPNCKII
jgi:hypothetical protein